MLLSVLKLAWRNNGLEHRTTCEFARTCNVFWCYHKRCPVLSTIIYNNLKRKMSRTTTISKVFLTIFMFVGGLGSSAKGQFWDPINGNFNGSGGFSAIEDGAWTGPQLVANNGGQLTFNSDAEHTGATSVSSGTSILVSGSFNHTNLFQDFRVTGSDGSGGFSSLTISDVANSNVGSNGFLLDNTALDLNSVSADSNVLIRSGARLSLIGDVSSGGFTSIETGAQVTAGGAFNHTNSSQDFRITGSDGSGGFSSLTISDVVNSNVSSNGFLLDNTALELNSVLANGEILIRSGAQLSVIGDVSSGGFTSIETGAQVVAGGAFNHSNSTQDFRVTGSDGNGGFSSLTISDVANSNVSSDDFLLDNTELDLNSVSANGEILIRSGAQLSVIGDVSSGGFTSIETGAQVVAGGAFNHTNSSQDFRVTGSDGNGGFSTLTISDVANSNVSSDDFLLDNTELDLNSVSANGEILIRSGAQLSVIGDVSSGGFTSIETGAQVVAGGAFNHTNSSQDFRVTGSDGNGGFSTLTISDVANSNVSSDDFLLDNTELDLNSVSANGEILID